MSGWRRWLTAMGLVVAVAALTLLSIALSPAAAPVPDIEPQRVKVKFLNAEEEETTRLASGARFSLVFNPRDPADVNGERSLVTGAALGLMKNGRTLYTLIARHGGEDAVIAPPRAFVHAIGFGAPGRLEFRLPRIRPGSYQLCSTFAFYAPNPPQVNPSREVERLCRTITVIG